jgi:hypothetical protein
MPVTCVILRLHPASRWETGNFCPITQRVAVISYRRFNKPIGLPLKMGPMVCVETSVRYYQTPCVITRNSAVLEASTCVTAV